MMFVNKLYMNQSNNIDPAFYTNSSEIYGIHVDSVGFQYPTAATKYINRIVSTHALHLSFNWLDREYKSQASILVLNFLY